MHHQSDPSDCHRPNGSLANASSMFSLYMNPTYHGIYIPDASHFEHAKERKKKKHIFINKSNSKRFYLQDETAKNWHYSCIKRKERLCSVSLFVYSCRVHKIKIHIYNISTARNVFISLELHYFHVHNSIKRTNKTKK